MLKTKTFSTALEVVCSKVRILEIVRDRVPDRTTKEGKICRQLTIPLSKKAEQYTALCVSGTDCRS